MRAPRVIPIALLLLAAMTGAADDAAFRAGVFDPPREAPDFALAGSDGSELRLARYRGKVVVLGFGFSSCPDVCPTTLSTLARARERLGAQAGDVQVVYVTVDPETDDAVRLREYLAAFDETFVGATGTPEALADVRRAYGIEAKRAEAGGGFSHSSYTYLIDRGGSLRALMPYGKSADDYVHDLRILLAAGGAAAPSP